MTVAPGRATPERDEMAAPSREFLYGLNPAFECIAAGRRRIYDAILNGATADRGRLKKLHEVLQRHDIPVYFEDKGRLHQLCKSTEHQGAVLRVSPYPTVPLAEVLTAAPARLLLLDNVEDPHNVGAIVRSADVFGFHHILLPIKGVPQVYPSVAKVSAGAVEHLQIVQESNSNRYVAAAREAGYHLAALDMKGSTTLADFAAAAPDKLLLVIGGEDRGVGQFILNQAETRLVIPQSGRVNSLNAGVAAALTMYALQTGAA